MARINLALAGLGALALVACATTERSTSTPSTGSGTAPNGAQPTPPANQDGTAAPSAQQ